MLEYIQATRAFYLERLPFWWSRPSTVRLRRECLVALGFPNAAGFRAGAGAAGSIISKDALAPSVSRRMTYLPYLLAVPNFPPSY